ncbi:MAG: hypothetical protein JWQ89_2280 [Devosia sp.]|uniref:hypothetical protein n=1 Tax=Devosia sp. TaxID=1871048 RepID=UPI00262F02CE|nr:hypothetical protein [Devosia sp.]MDB5540553.1 hypothetical protein [Devosia sp.]
MQTRHTIPGSFGDCEITSIGFEYPDVHVKIIDKSNADFYSATFFAVKYILLETDHVQNVMSFIHYFDNVVDGLRNEEFSEWIGDRGLLTEIEGIAGNHRIYFLTPITGANIVIVCEGVRLS